MQIVLSSVAKPNIYTSYTSCVGFKIQHASWEVFKVFCWETPGGGVTDNFKNIFTLSPLLFTADIFRKKRGNDAKK